MISRYAHASPQRATLLAAVKSGNLAALRQFLQAQAPQDPLSRPQSNLAWKMVVNWIEHCQPATEPRDRHLIMGLELLLTFMRADRAKLVEDDDQLGGSILKALLERGTQGSVWWAHRNRFQINATMWPQWQRAIVKCRDDAQLCDRQLEVVANEDKPNMEAALLVLALLRGEDDERLQQRRKHSTTIKKRQVLTNLVQMLAMMPNAGDHQFHPNQIPLRSLVWLSKLFRPEQIESVATSEGLDPQHIRQTIAPFVQHVRAAVSEMEARGMESRTARAIGTGAGRQRL